VQSQVAGNEIRKIDASAYTISGSVAGTIHGSATNSSSTNGHIRMESPRFKFIDQNELPNPHNVVGRIKLYPSGRGSSVPLNLNNLA
jgi:WAS/WASL-interacting protein